MTSRDRIRKALNHQEPDRIPVDLGGSIVSSITKNAYRDLRERLGLLATEPEIIDIVQQLPRVEDDVRTALKIDTVPLAAGAGSAWELKIEEEGDYLLLYDEWGSRLRMPKQGGHYFDWWEYPLKESTMDALRKFKWPDPHDPARYAGLKDKAKELYENTEYAIVGSALSGGGIFEQPERVRGSVDFFMDLVSNEKFADGLMQGFTDFYIAEYGHFLDEVGDYIQVIVYWNDVAGQNAPLISPELYRRLIKPKEQRLFSSIKKKTNAKIFYHLCGAAYEFIPDLIEIGVDILNPVQVSAAGMDTGKLKREFGKDIVFWGGGCDTQRILPFGTVDEVKDEVKRRIEDLAPGGGFVFHPVHNIQDGVPAENIMAMFETIWEHWQY
ncbi:MAG TPA: uroporphyrinogen decarboxylase family protein [Sedimentisphaerales bacterium]|nr:uroporphyrinogen decarboxylase family protein [Sedimentisphaerales bacterium]